MQALTQPRGRKQEQTEGPPERLWIPCHAGIQHLHFTHLNRTAATRSPKHKTSLWRAHNSNITSEIDIHLKNFLSTSLCSTHTSSRNISDHSSCQRVFRHVTLCWALSSTLDHLKQVAPIWRNGTANVRPTLTVQKKIHTSALNMFGTNATSLPSVGNLAPPSLQGPPSVQLSFWCLDPPSTVDFTKEVNVSTFISHFAAPRPKGPVENASTTTSAGE